MTEQDPGGTLHQTKANRIARRLVELVAGAALVGMALYELWTLFSPTTNIGLVGLGALAVVFFVCVLVLKKWPSC